MQRGVSQNTRERWALQPREGTSTSLPMSRVFPPLSLKTVLCADVPRPEENWYRIRTQLGEQVAAMARHRMFIPNQGLSMDGVPWRLPCKSTEIRLSILMPRF